MRDKLADLNILDDTVIFFAGDNGPSKDHNINFFNSAGPFRGYKGTLYEGGIR